MRTFDELEALWSALPPAPRERGTVRLLCVRREDGAHDTPTEVQISLEGGVVGDRWAHGWQRRDPERNAQVTLMNASVTEMVAALQADLHLDRRVVRAVLAAHAQEPYRAALTGRRR
ncbi:MAG TPA: hypothetical protein VHK28_09465, partial [Candidatus Limnocylindria bacterium]|nr:hypothetical protein [Candidatus Limnocylindria bacterium]